MTDTSFINFPSVGFSHEQRHTKPQKFVMIPDTNGALPVAMVKRAMELEQNGVPPGEVGPVVRREVRHAIKRAFRNSEYYEWLKTYAAGRFHLRCRIATSQGKRTGPVLDLSFKDRISAVHFIFSFA